MEEERAESFLFPLHGTFESPLVLSILSPDSSETVVLLSVLLNPKVSLLGRGGFLAPPRYVEYYSELLFSLYLATFLPPEPPPHFL